MGCRAWSIEWPSSLRFAGTIQNCRVREEEKKGDVDKSKSKSAFGKIYVDTEKKCRETCLMSDLPILAGLYDIQGKDGVYYEVTITRMDGIIAIGKLNEHTLHAIGHSLINTLNT